MIQKRMIKGVIGSNCYILGINGEGAIIDPGAPHEDVIENIKQMGIEIKYIILTHAHYDHIAFVDLLNESVSAKVAIHEADAACLLNPLLNGSMLFGRKDRFKEADVLLNDGDFLEVGGEKLEIIHTPGHTRGSICIKLGNDLFTGDTLFRLSKGRTDLPGGDDSKMYESLLKLMKLNEGTMVYPGHGDSSTIGYEKEYNPFI